MPPKTGTTALAKGERKRGVSMAPIVAG
jgi:hypothetical protein